MSTTDKLAVYGAALALVAGVGWVIGDAVGPADGVAGAESPSEHGHVSENAERDSVVPSRAKPEGLGSTHDGYLLSATGPTVLRQGVETPFSFQITGPDGAAITEFEVDHGSPMRLSVVRRDTSGFQHLQPALGQVGTWTVPLTLTLPGSYRAFADFTPRGGEPMVLGIDIAVPGDFRPVEHQPAAAATVDGYRVEMNRDLVPGRTIPLALIVFKDGKPVTDLQVHLGGYGHLVVLDTRDLAYQRVPPAGSPMDGITEAGPAIRFDVEVPTGGIYRMYLEFRHDGTVHTAEFTVQGGAR